MLSARLWLEVLDADNFWISKVPKAVAIPFCAGEPVPIFFAVDTSQQRRQFIFRLARRQCHGALLFSRRRSALYTRRPKMGLGLF